MMFNVMIYVVEMNEWGCGLYGGAGNLLTFVSFCDKNTGVWVICGAGYSVIIKLFPRELNKQTYYYVLMFQIIRVLVQTLLILLYSYMF